MAVAVPGEGALTRRLTSRGIRVALVTPQGAAPTRMAFLARSFLWSGQLARLARDLEASVVHANTHLAAAAVGMACRHSGLPGLVHLHGAPSTVAGKVFWRFGIRAVPRGACVAVSHHVAQNWFGGGRPAAWVVHNGIRLDEFVWRGRVSQQVPLILNVGQITPRKGQHVLIEAMLILRQRGLYPKAVFAGGIVSSGINTRRESLRYLARLRRMVRELALEGQVSFMGEVQDISELYRKATVMAHTALAEALGAVLQEAMAVGVPVVAPRVGGIPELIEDGRSGLLYDKENSEGLAEALATLLGNEELGFDLCVAARRRMEERFDARLMAMRMAGIYETLCSGFARIRPDTTV